MEHAKEQITKLEVGSFTTKNIKTAHQKSTLKEVHDLMEDFKISHIPICSESGEPVGIVAERDVRAFYLSPEFHKLVADQIMQKKFLTYPSSALLSTVTKELADSSGCAAIIRSTSNDRLEIFTVSDALTALNHVYETIG